MKNICWGSWDGVWATETLNLGLSRKYSSGWVVLAKSASNTLGTRVVAVPGCSKEASGDWLGEEEEKLPDKLLPTDNSLVAELEDPL